MRRVYTGKRVRDAFGLIPNSSIGICGLYWLGKEFARKMLDYKRTEDERNGIWRDGERPDGAAIKKFVNSLLNQKDYLEFKAVDDRGW